MTCEDPFHTTTMVEFHLQLPITESMFLCFMDVVHYGPNVTLSKLNFVYFDCLIYISVANGKVFLFVQSLKITRSYFDNLVVFLGFTAT